jgi:hypothetical protein
MKLIATLSGMSNGELLLLIAVLATLLAIAVHGKNPPK